MKPSGEWYRDFFRNSFYNPASPAALAAAPAEASFVLKRLGLGKGAALLDLCCGPGRHAVEFARRGLAVTGYDYSRQYLREAAARAKKAGVELRLVRGDMRELPFRGEFDAVADLFTSFGYFPAYSDDLRTLKGAARALKPGGLFLIDVINGDFVRGSFAPRDWHDLGDHYLLEERELRRDGTVNSWTRIDKRSGRTLTRTFYNRLYGRAEITAALRRAGLRPVKFWGGFDGRPLSPGTVRLICLARKG